MKFLAFLLLVACPKKTPTVEQPQWLEGDDEEVAEIPVPVEAGEWRGDGVSVWVSPGWSAGHTMGPPETLTMLDGESGAELVIQLGPDTFELPRSCAELFEDSGTYRTVPLDELRTASCIEQDGTLLQVWTGRADFVAVRIAARYPMGSAVSGRQRVEAVLSTISAAGGG